MTKQTPIQKFEALAQQLIEGSFNRFLGGGLMLSDIAAELARVAENKAAAGVAPCQYEIRVNPALFDKIAQEESDAIAQLTNYLQAFMRQAELSLAGSLYLTLVADPDVTPRALLVEVVAMERPSTQAVTQIRQQSDAADWFAADIAALDAYLIVDGQRHVPLTKPVTSLGRNIDNDVVLDAPTVSRQHAQIRWRYGRFILYDVSRRGRTQVNNQIVNEMVLKSGDVISLSDVKLIYGEGETQQRPRPRPASSLNDETQIRPPSNT
jgi:hypothetical protein